MSKAILYSFRRCPYCIRAHLGLKKSGLKVELREVSLKTLPEAILKISPKATVPVLLLESQKTMDESWDILKWAIENNDPDNWLGDNKKFLTETEMLVETNDFSFKRDLDHYKYADRYPEHSAEHYRAACEEFLEELEEALTENDFLLTNQLSIADIAIFPFVRQFSLVDKTWFEQAPYPKLQQWLKNIIDTALFQDVFQKHNLWEEGAAAVYV